MELLCYNLYFYNNELKINYIFYKYEINIL